MHLVDVGHGIIALGQVADPSDGRHVAIHRIDALEYDQLWAMLWHPDQQILQMRDVVVPPDRLGHSRRTHALDHRVVAERVGHDQAVGQQPGNGRDAGEIGDIARCEDQCRLLAVQIGELGFQGHDSTIGAGNIARAAGAGAHATRGIAHGVDYLGVLAHAKIIIRAPDNHVAHSIRSPPACMWKSSSLALEISEDPVAALVLESRQSGLEVMQKAGLSIGVEY